MIALGSGKAATREWDTSTAHLQIFVEGFIGKYWATTPQEEAIDYVKAFVGLAVALQLFKVKPSFSRTPSKATFFVHRKIGGKWVIERLLELDNALSDAIQGLVFIEGAKITEKVTPGWVRYVCKKIEGVFTGAPSTKVALGGSVAF